MREKRDETIILRLSKTEKNRIYEKMLSMGIRSLSAYIRKMALDGYCLHLDLKDLQRMAYLLQMCSNNLNQYAKAANENGRVYAADMEDLQQRGMLAEKAANPHLLVMSATPIPRTLGLLIYGDLDISILDELPPGRTPVKTRCITGKKRRDLYHFLDQEIGRGRQVYLVCPAIEDTPDGGLNAVKCYYEDIAKALLPERRVGLMHGKLKPKEKAAVMEDFKAGRLDALVSTTVIEVGVDVPNASVMVIENAERYGLSALHQLRGRVGRGAAESWCFLVSDNQSENVQKRLKFLCSTTDGFAVAQYDLETRGPGDFFGSRQHGLPTLQIADLMNDRSEEHTSELQSR